MHLKAIPMENFLVPPPDILVCVHPRFSKSRLFEIQMLLFCSNLSLTLNIISAYPNFIEREIISTKV